MPTKITNNDKLYGALIRYRADNDANMKIIDSKLDQIITHQVKQNGTLEEHSKKLLDLDVNKAQNCPYSEDIQTLKTHELTREGIRKTMKKHLTLTIAILAGIVSLIVIIDRFLIK